MSSCPDQIKLLLDQQEKLSERQSELKFLLEDCSASASAGNDGAVITENWSGPFQWDSQADDIRFNVFGITNYRANQREVSAILVSRSAYNMILLKTSIVDSWLLGSVNSLVNSYEVTRVSYNSI